MISKDKLIEYHLINEKARYEAIRAVTASIKHIAVELIDLYGKSIKQTADTMNTDMRQVNRWLHKGRVKILSQIFK